MFSICFFYQELHAKTTSCRDKILIIGAITTAMTLSTEATGGLVSWSAGLSSSTRAYDLFRSRWPYSQLNEANINNLSPETLNSKIITVMDQFESFYFHSSESERTELAQLLTPDFFDLTDQSLTELSPLWLRLKGGRESVWLDLTHSSTSFPLGVTTLYDSTPQTLGLYQFTVIESWGYYIVITHHAWFTEVPDRFDRFAAFDSYREGRLEVPNSASVSSLLLAGVLSFKRRR